MGVMVRMAIDAVASRGTTTLSVSTLQCRVVGSLCDTARPGLPGPLLDELMDRLIRWNIFDFFFNFC